MFFCPQCNSIMPDGTTRCNVCGAIFQPQQPQYGNVMPNVPQEPRPSIAKAIVSMGLSGMAIVMAAMSLLYSFAFAAGGAPTMVGIIFNFIMAIFILPLAIVGLVLGSGYLNSNAVRIRGLASAGKILGIVSLGVFAFGFLVSFISF